MNKELKKEAREDIEKLREPSHFDRVYGKSTFGDEKLYSLVDKYIDKATLSERKRCAKRIRGETIHVIVAGIHLNGYIHGELGKKVNAGAVDEAVEAIATAIEEGEE